jgi:hypothetical protein
MELNPKAKKMWAYVQAWNFVLPTLIHVDSFCRHNTNMTAEEKVMFKEMWLKLNNKEDCCEADDLENMTKQQLDDYAKEAYDIELDRRQTKENMLKELDEALGYYNEE